MRHLPITPTIASEAVLLAVALAVLGGCSNSYITPATRNDVSFHRVRSAGYILQTVDYTGKTDTQLTGINSSNEVVGNYIVSTTASNVNWLSFTSQDPYSSFQSVTFPFNNAQSTYMYAISDDPNPILVGYIFNPNNQTGDWGVVRNKSGIWSMTRRVGNEEQCSANQKWKHALLGFDTGSKIAVGYYTDSTDSCNFKPYEVEAGDNNNTNPFKGVPGAWKNTEATGIASNLDIVGTTTYKSALYGWFLSNGSTSRATPTKFQCCNFTTGNYPTTVNGIVRTTGASPHEFIVGSYTPQGSSPTYGFVYDKTATTNPWTYPIVAFGSNDTVVTGVNSDGSICGRYRASNHYHGFVGFVAAAPKRHHRRPPLAIKGP